MDYVLIPREHWQKLNRAVLLGDPKFDGLGSMPSLHKRLCLDEFAEMVFEVGLTVWAMFSSDPVWEKA
jgi:hypothetical protein